MTIFHYTNISALHSILTTKKLWFTDIRFLNDSREFYDGLNFVNEVLPSVTDANALAPREFEYAKKSIKEVIGEISSNSGYSFLNFNSPYVCSFSRKVDSLSQWRGYGMYAIEFDEDVLKGFHGLNLVECLYEKDSKWLSAVDGLQAAIAEFTDEFKATLNKPTMMSTPVAKIAVAVSWHDKCRADACFWLP
jgi:hypothetical protein